MKNQIAETNQYPNIPQGVSVPSGDINQGTVLVESQRAIAEAQGKLVIAKKFPRDPIAAYNRVMEACHRKGLAEKAFYKYSRGGSSVTGPTIRFAEELARCWGNVDYGIKELSQDTGKSEMQAYAWDLETNTISVQNFTNMHIRETGGRSVTLTSQRDIYEVNANMGARRLRARILAILPSDLVEDAIEECKKTLAGETDVPLTDRVRKMVVSFAKYGVTQEMIETRLGRKIESMNADDFVDYVGIFNSLKDGMSKVADWFEAPIEASELTANLNEMIKMEEENGK